MAQTGRINAFLKRAYRCGFSGELLTVEQFLYSSATCFFNKMQHPTHCRDIITQFSGHHPEVKREAEFEDGYIVVGGSGA